MKITIERKTIRLKMRDAFGKEEFFPGPGYCFDFRGYELACCGVRQPGGELWCFFILAATGCGIMDPVQCPDCAAAIFHFFEMSPELLDHLERVARDGLAGKVRDRDFDLIKEDRERQRRRAAN
jgi:hypothetical protein